MMFTTDWLLGATHEIIKRGLIHSGLGQAEVDTCFLIGSQAYPEYGRPDSDIDLVAVVKNARPADKLNWRLEYAGRNSIEGRDCIFELQCFTEESLETHLEGGSLSLCFGFVRGHKILYDRGGSAVRFSSLAERSMRRRVGETISALHCVDIAGKIRRMRIRFTEQHNALLDRRLLSNRLLAEIRIGECIVEFCVQLGVLHFARLVQSTGVTEPTDDLKRGLIVLLMLNEHRGGRMLDIAKYGVEDPIRSVAIALASCMEEHDCDPGRLEAIFTVLGNCFATETGRPLLLGLNEPAEVVSASGGVLV